MNRGVAVFSHDALGNKNRVFEVVTVPRHERDQKILTQRQLTISVDAPSAITSFLAMWSLTFTSGR